MNHGMVDLWNETVKKTDIVYIIGDFIMNKVEDNIKFAKRLNGTKYLIAGNHDKVHPMRNKKITDQLAWEQFYLDKGDVWVMRTQQLLNISLGELGLNPLKFVLACHFPFDSVIGEYDHRYEELHPEWEPYWMVHGHTHSKEKIRDNMIHVGVDAWDYKPVSLEEIRALIEASPNKDKYSFFQNGK